MPQLQPGLQIKVVAHHIADRVTGSEIPHNEGNEGDTDQHKEQTNQSFGDKLDHVLPLALSFKVAWLSCHTLPMRAKDSDQATAVPGLLCTQKNLLRLFCIRITDYCVR